jgi:hypothetical protein
MQHWLPKRWTARCRTEKVFWYSERPVSNV